MKVGIVGVGFMGTTHASGWADTTAKIVGFTAETQPEAGALANQYNAKIYPSLDAMLTEVDVVDICSPTHLHHEMILKAAAAGKHIVCEKPLARTTVHSVDGGDLAEFYKERRYFVPVRDVPDIVKKAFLAAEDQRFYTHHGFDIKGILRALRRNIAANTVVEGGSTITQQLAKMLIKNPERSYSRKLHEMVIALKLEWKYSKEEILGGYLNLAYFGERVYGIETAARTYFNKSVKDLNIPEAALLAGLLKAPSAYSTLKDPALARERMKTVLNEMLALKNITGEEYVSALSWPLPETVFFQRKFKASGSSRGDRLHLLLAEFRAWARRCKINLDARSGRRVKNI